MHTTPAERCRKEGRLRVEGISPSLFQNGCPIVFMSYLGSFSGRGKLRNVETLALKTNGSS